MATSFVASITLANFVTPTYPSSYLQHLSPQSQLPSLCPLSVSPFNRPFKEFRYACLIMPRVILSSPLSNRLRALFLLLSVSYVVASPLPPVAELSQLDRRGIDLLRTGYYQITNGVGKWVDQKSGSSNLFLRFNAGFSRCVGLDPSGSRKAIQVDPLTILGGAINFHCYWTLQGKLVTRLASRLNTLWPEVSLFDKLIELKIQDSLASDADDRYIRAVLDFLMQNGIVFDMPKS
ncbi:hypothetical protein J3R30DRAFT_593965 [Lentinula aciculospora]|uniref:Uncharacterized protein n=1 Tax=Lentinula aciculospora TaxID=153920 RepID=A0A9W9DLS5_9AGAR|nr:hypothetical protein J3R30DRAFT_593965 [Lentinula aciculospora]